MKAITNDSQAFRVLAVVFKACGQSFKFRNPKIKEQRRVLAAKLNDVLDCYRESVEGKQFRH